MIRKKQRNVSLNGIVNEFSTSPLRTSKGGGNIKFPLQKGYRAMSIWLVVALLLPTAIGCDRELEDAYDNFLDKTPFVCKNYCGDQAACGRMTGTGEYESDQYQSEVHLCEVECTAYAAEGAYVWHDELGDNYDRVLFEHISGDEFMDLVDCMDGIGAFRCVLRDGDYRMAFSPLVSNICEAANECVDHLDLKLSYQWLENTEGLGGVCQQTGGDFIDAVFF